jgi:hypothetical protein
MYHECKTRSLPDSFQKHQVSHSNSPDSI